MSGDGNEPVTDGDADPQFLMFQVMLGMLLELNLDPDRREGDVSALDTEARLIAQNGRSYLATLRLVSGHGAFWNAQPTLCELHVGDSDEGTIFQLYVYADGRGELVVIDTTDEDEPPCPRPELPAEGSLTTAQQGEALLAFANFLLKHELLDA